MSQEIAVVGSPDFTTGFRLAGVRKFENVPDEEKAEALDDAVENVLTDEGVGIVVMHDDDLEHLSRGVRQDVETSVEPVVVTLDLDDLAHQALVADVHDVVHPGVQARRRYDGTADARDGTVFADVGFCCLTHS